MFFFYFAINFSKTKDMKLPASTHLLNANPDLFSEELISSNLKYFKHYPAFGEYLLIISPPDMVKDAVVWYKNLLAKHIGNFTAYYSIAHLSIISFQIHAKWQKVLLHSLEVIAAEEAPFTFKINSFGCFDSSGTVYLKLEEIERFAKICSNFYRNSFIRNLPGAFKFPTYMPHLTIGRSLGPNFDKAWDLFQQQNYSQTFTVSGVLLLKRDNQGKLKPVQEFPFLSKSPAQLALFTL
ncbi:MAG: hypothetical protein COW65_10025 [Cytophagales bacterium CG18_big_fil_WC_8_21_14_2_50_42_9]|nr:MAG: hypothetical protein COW65_10025 [Cytophagales bacterium CG18_big_fil_WC_8_21_14_2_50_42_9]